MKKQLRKPRRLLKNNKGQGMVEYILLLVIVIGLLMAFKGQIASVIKGKTEQVGSDINSFNGE